LLFAVLGDIGKKNNSVFLNWQTCNEADNKGFYVERSTDNLTWNILGRLRQARN